MAEIFGGVTTTPINPKMFSGGGGVATVEVDEDGTLIFGGGSNSGSGVGAEGTQSDNSIPDYWQDALDEGVKAINTAMLEAGQNKSAFLFYTDAHWNYGSKMSPKLLKYLYQHTGMTKTNFGGDIVNNEATDYDTMSYLWEWRNQLKGLPNHHSVVGNHDDGNEPNNLFSEQYIYGYLLAAEETPDIVRGNSGLYYYIDNPAEKTRYLYLDTAYQGFNANQQVFVKEALLSTPENWHIIAISHIWYDTIYNGALREVGALSKNVSTVLDMFDKYNSRIGDYEKCKGKVEFCIGGHTHLDYNGSYNGILIILVATDSQHTGGANFTYGENTEASVNGIIADYDANKVEVVRIGRGKSRTVSLNGDKYYSVKNNLTNVTTSNKSTQIKEGNSYETTLTTSGTITYVVITMNGIDITESAYNADTGVISIAQVTGDIVITAIAEVENITNTNMLETVGYQSGKRINSSGVESESGTHFITGFIPFTKNDVLYGSADIFNEFDVKCNIVVYDENKKFITNAVRYVDNSYNTIVTTTNGFVFSPLNASEGTSYWENVAYVRITSLNITENSVITKTSYTNRLLFSIDADGESIYNGKGYKENVRWSTSNNAEQATDGAYLSGYIAASAGDIIRLKNITISNTETNRNFCTIYCCSEFGNMENGLQLANTINERLSPVWDENGNLVQFTMQEGTMYFRLQAAYIGADSIVTVNEPIE